jgi:cysteinyl-tRNA synthetase
MALSLYDTMTREQRPFEPRDEGRASIYVCGPTVYAPAHVGHGRYAVVFDVLRRYLASSGYDVTYVTNITDVDDKIIMKATRERTSTAVIATRYTHAWNRTMERIGVLAPDVQPFATGHLLDMIELIETLVERGMAYEADGNVLFRVRAHEGYGKLSGRQVDDMVSQDDVVGTDVKEDPLDFAMWKAAKPGEPAWPSPWGRGRPGWHIECSAMAAKHLGHGFDIHGGGYDLTFPHHENEIAQHEAAHGAPFARHWVHNGMVRMGEEKMSKSLGNIVSLDEAYGRWGRGPLRLWYLSAHHRSPLTFDTERLDEASASFERLVTFLKTAAFVVDADTEPDEAAAASHRAAFAAAMDADLNAPKAVAALHDLVSEGHDLLRAAEGGDEAARSAIRALGDTLVELADEVLGLGLEHTVGETQLAADRLAPLVEHLLTERRDAREARDFDTADAIRDRLSAAGVVVEDRPAGSRWYVDPAAGSRAPLTAS